jgi:AcrR family transcriptional regulator
MVRTSKQVRESVSEGEPAPRVRPGGRAATVVAAVRKAAFELLAERGYEGVEIPDIALRAGVNRTTIYRRWPTKSELLLDMMLEEMQAKVPTPDTGSFEEDLAALLRSIAQLLADPLMRSLFHIIGGRTDHDDQTAKARERFWNERFTVSGQIVTRAIARGEVADGVSARAVLELGAAPLFYRMLILGETFDNRAAADLAAWVVGQNLTDFPLSVAEKR